MLGSFSISTNIRNIFGFSKSSPLYYNNVYGLLTKNVSYSPRKETWHVFCRYKNEKQTRILNTRNAYICIV